MILSRCRPARKGRTINLDLPPVSAPADIVPPLGRITRAVAGGEITPEGAAVAAVLEGKRKAIETVDVLARIEKLERERSQWSDVLFEVCLQESASPMQAGFHGLRPNAQQ